MLSYITIGNSIVLALNIFHNFIYLDLKRHNRKKVAAGIVIISLPMLFMHTPGNLPNLSALLIGPLLVFCYAPVFKHLIFEGSYGRMLTCMFAMGSFTHILLISCYLFLHYVLAVPVDAGLYVQARLCSIIIYVPGLFLMHRYARTPFRIILDGLEAQHWYPAVGAPLFIFLLGILTHVIFFHYTSDITMALALVTMGIIVAFYWCLYFATTQADKNRFLADTIESAKKLAGIYENYNALLDGKEKTIRTLRHDYRHALVVIADMAENGDTEGIVRQMDTMDKFLHNTAVVVHSENVTIKAILSYYFSQADEMGIVFTSAIDVPVKISLPEAELVALTGNALENCLKGAGPLGKAGFIDVSIAQVRSCLVLRFRNNFRPGHYARGSGLGLVSIRMICDKYEGDLQVREDNDIFEVSAVLQTEPPVTDQR